MLTASFEIKENSKQAFNVYVNDVEAFANNQQVITFFKTTFVTTLNNHLCTFKTASQKAPSGQAYYYNREFNIYVYGDLRFDEHDRMVGDDQVALMKAFRDTIYDWFLNNKENVEKMISEACIRQERIDLNNSVAKIQNGLIQIVDITNDIIASPVYNEISEEMKTLINQLGTTTRVSKEISQDIFRRLGRK